MVIINSYGGGLIQVDNGVHPPIPLACLSLKHLELFWGHKWHFLGKWVMVVLDAKEIIDSIGSRKIYSLNRPSKRVILCINRDNMPWLKPREVFIPTYTIRAQHPLLLHLLGLAFWMFMVSHYLFMIIILPILIVTQFKNVCRHHISS